ncbi:cytochrome b [Rhizobium sp. SGZ-381]|uniref:cytochrome b n=1 Tax=Rhizobium sp. SGZ-381 TaxID=3342800 RepID=UPI0036720197
MTRTGREMRYPAPMRVMHWLVAALVAVVWPLGMVIKFTREDVKLDFYLLHESLGFIVLWLMLVRVGTRLTASSPLPSPAAGLEGCASRLVHGLLYCALVVMPLSGFLATNAHGFPLRWFNIVPIWSPIGKAPAIAPWFSAIHSVSAWILFGLIALHLGAVLFHHIIRRDDTLTRIL